MKKVLLALIALTILLPTTVGAAVINYNDSQTIEHYGNLFPSTHYDTAKGTEASPTAVQDGDAVGAIGARPYNGSAFSEHSTGAFYFRATQNHTSVI